MARTDPLATWQREAAELCRPIRWLPFWRPRIVVKRGHFSPWFWPFLWPAKSGAFTLFFLLIVSEDLLHCSPPHRREHRPRVPPPDLLSHHGLDVGCDRRVKECRDPRGVAGIGAHQGPFVALGTLLAFLGLILVGFRALLYWFEHQADDYAVARVGAADLVAALSWLGTATFGAEASP